MNGDGRLPADSICFGLSRELDEHSLSVFLKLFSRDQLLEVLVPRLSDEEIEQVVDLLSSLMRGRLQEKEYHELFLDDHAHHH